MIGTVRGESRWEIAPRPGGSTIRFWSRGPAPGPLAWMPWLARLVGQRGLQGDVERLARLAEGEV